jgi:cell division transport system permease protein
VETFSSDHNKVYSLLILIQNIVFILFLVVLILSILLLSKQIKIWFYEHEERITIIQLHGGTLFYSSIPILKTIITSAIVSSVVVYAVLYLVAVNLAYLVAPEITMILPPHINMSFEIIYILLLAFFIPMVTFVGLLVRYKFR